jgi:hypothetical protein
MDEKKRKKSDVWSRRERRARRAIKTRAKDWKAGITTT